MNIVSIPQLVKQSALTLALLGSSILLSACGGGGGHSSTSSSSSSSSSSSTHSFSSASVTPPGSGTWPDVKVSASGTKQLKFEWTNAPNSDHFKLWKKADASASYIQVGSNFNSNSVTDSISVHLTDWVNSRYKVQACDQADACQDSSEIVTDSAMLNAITYLKASNANADDWFGWSLAIAGDGQTMAIGAPGESSSAIGINGDQNNNDSPTSGAVYVFAKVNGLWQQQAYLKASNTQQPGDAILPNARFGYQVGLSSDGNTLAVSAINEDSPSDGINCDQNPYAYSSSTSSGDVTRYSNLDVGAIYIFKRNSNQWTQTTYIKPFVAMDQNRAFGTIFTLSGDGKTLVVGDPSDSNYVTGAYTTMESASSSSCINFSESSTSSSSSSSSSSSDSSTSSSSSSSLSSIPGGPNSGLVYVYRETANGWIEDAVIKASDAGAGDLFGTSVTLSQDGKLLAVGAPYVIAHDSSSSARSITLNDITEPLYTGAVYVFTRSDTDGWVETSKINPSTAQWRQSFGEAVVLSGDGSTLAVGTPGDWSVSGGANADPTDYTPEAVVSYNSIGVACCISPHPTSTYASGAAYIFRKSGDNWNQQAYLKAPHPMPAFQFGTAVALSYDGNVFAAGSYVDSSRATGINGDDQDTSEFASGAAFVYQFTNMDWIFKSYVKAPNAQENDRFGHALSLDYSGADLLIGAHRESSNGTGINSGAQADNSASAAGAAYLY